MGKGLLLLSLLLVMIVTSYIILKVLAGLLLILFLILFLYGTPKPLKFKKDSKYQTNFH
jgi:hypothetical protein